MTRKIKLLLADDHPMVRTGLKKMLEQQHAFIPNIVEADDGERTIELLKALDFDILLLDISLPNISGLSVINYCKEHAIHVPILVISMHIEPHIVKQAIDAGALGYLTKNTGIEELTKAINTVLKLKPYYCNEAAQALLSKTNRKIVVNKSSSEAITSLTRRERKIIQLIVKELSNPEIAEQLSISVRTVEGHRTRINNKLNVKGTAALIRIALTHGLVDQL